MTILKRISIFLMGLSIFLGVLGLTSAPNTRVSDEIEKCKYWHKVERDEYLIKIGKLYNVNWRYIAELNEIAPPYRIFPNQSLCISTTRRYHITPLPTALPITGSGAKIYAASVVEDKSVILVGKGLPRLTYYSIYLSNDRAKVPTEILVGTILTDRSGVFRESYDLPKKLIDVPKIRATVKNGLIVITSDWFINGSADKYTGGGETLPFSIKVVDVTKNEIVKIETTNLPANITLDVYIGEEDTQGKDGYEVGTLTDPSGGKVNASFTIPKALSGQDYLDLRLENDLFEIVVYKKFKND